MLVVTYLLRTHPNSYGAVNYAANNGIVAVSLAVSLIGLYRVCLNRYSATRTTKSLRKDAGTLLVELGLEEVRLITWGVSISIRDGGGTRPEHLNIDIWQVDAVIKIPGEISKVMTDTQKLHERYNIIAYQSP
jgi:hypothetical protein